MGHLQLVEVSKWTLYCLFVECIDSCAEIPCSDLLPLSKSGIEFVTVY